MLHLMGNMAPKQIQTQVHYNRWANQRLLEASAALTPEDRERDLHASFASLQGTLIHILWGERSWLRRETSSPALHRMTMLTSLLCSAHGPRTTKPMRATCVISHSPSLTRRAPSTPPPTLSASSSITPSTTPPITADNSRSSSANSATPRPSPTPRLPGRIPLLNQAAPSHFREQVSTGTGETDSSQLDLQK